MDNELYYGPIFNEFFYDKQDIFDKLPVLPIFKDSSPTDYIDYICLDMMTDPIMKGHDVYGRPFIAIRYHCLDNSDINILSKYSPKDNISLSVICIFQRYSNNPNLLVVGSNYYHVINSIGGLQENSKDWLRRLMAGELVEDPLLVENISDIVKLGDDIKKNWILC